MTIHVMPNHKSGDWWDGISLVRVSMQGVGIDLTGAAIVMTVKPFDSQAVAVSKSVGSGITITNAAAGEFQVDGFSLSLPPSKYEVEIVVTAADGKPRTVFEADWTITARAGG